MMPLTLKNQNRGRPGPRAIGGFTIIEMMAVLLIMLLLLAVLTPTVQKVYRMVLRSTSLSTVRLIDGACKQYYEQMDEYPPSTHAGYSGWDGKELLVLFLTGYGPDENSDSTPGTNLSTDDGCTGFGFRLEKRGLVCGPYNGAEKVKTKSGTNGPVFIDSFDEEIYYYCYDPLEPGGAPFGHYATDNLDGPVSTYPFYGQGHKGFILATRGPDGVFEPFDDEPDTDDITNFLEEQ